MKNKYAWERYKELVKERPEMFVNSGTIHIVMDEFIVEEFERETGRTIGVCYESPYNIMVVDLVYEVEGKYFAYERLLPAVSKGAVVCIPKYNQKYVLLKQYRHALRDYQYSFPRGYAEKNLSTLENVQKELNEEINAHVISSDFIGTVVADSGINGNKVEIYLCEIDSYKKANNYEGITEIIEVSFQELTTLVRENKISDGFTLSAYAHMTLLEYA